MLALCSVLSETYYAQNDAGIIGLGLPADISLKLHIIEVFTVFDEETALLQLCTKVTF